MPSLPNIHSSPPEGPFPPKLPESSKADRFPSHCAVELTYRCNHACAFCSNPWATSFHASPVSLTPRELIHGTSGRVYPREPELTGTEWTRHLRALAAMGVSSFSITGGEPTLHPDFLPVLRAVTGLTIRRPYLLDGGSVSYCQVPVRVSLFTNGDTDVFSPVVFELLIQRKVTLLVGMTGTRVLHERLSQGCYSRTAHTLHGTLSRGINVVLNLTITRGNEGDAVRCAREFLETGIRHINLMRVVPVGRARDPDQFRALISPPEMFIKTVQAISEMCTTHGTRCTIGNALPRCVFPPDVVPEVGRSYLCACGSQGFCLDPSGLVRPCTCSPIVLGHISDILGAMHSSRLEAFLNRDPPSSCVGCPDLDSCSGGCPAGWDPSAGECFPSPLRSPAVRGDPWLDAGGEGEGQKETREKGGPTTQIPKEGYYHEN